MAYYATSTTAQALSYRNFVWTYPISFNIRPIFVCGEFTSSGHGYILRPNRNISTNAKFELDVWNTTSVETYALFFAIGY